MKVVFFRISTFVLIISFLSDTVLADGVKIDKVYDPYVQVSEKELELRSNFYQSDRAIDFSVHRLGLGYGISERWFVEVYAVGEKSETESLSLETIELEGKWQLTEQGEFSYDWGLLFELEDERDNDAFEFATTLLGAKDIGRWTALANFGLIVEWGDDVQDEVETAFSSQLRYRLSRGFEPGFELYIGQDTQGVGPVVQGAQALAGRRNLHWEGGAIFGLEDATPDLTIRLLLEYEF